MEINFQAAWDEPAYTGAAVLEYLGTIEEKPVDLYRPKFVVATTLDPAAVMKGGARRAAKREQKRTRRVLRRKLRALTRSRAALKSA